MRGLPEVLLLHQTKRIRNSLLAQRVKDSETQDAAVVEVRFLPGNFCMPRVWPEKKRTKLFHPKDQLRKVWAVMVGEQVPKNLKRHSQPM